MSLSGPFIVRPVATVLLWLGVVLAGWLAHSLLPIAPLPQIEFPVIGVRAQMPGASPEVMAATVATPLERSLGTIAGVSEMTSRSTTGQTRITLQFDLSRDINSAATDVQGAINAARALMPSGLRSNPSYNKANPASAPIMTLALTSDSLSQGQLYDIASTIVQQKLSQVEGVGEVQIGGSSLPAVRIDINPDALTQAGVSLEAVRLAIASANSTRPKGLLENEHDRWQITANDQLWKAEQYRPLIVAWRNGAPLRLSDVAQVEDAVEDAFNIGYFNTKQAILVLVRSQAKANIIQTVDQIRADLPVLRAMLPADVTVSVAQDRTPSIRASVYEAEKTLLIAIGLVMMVVLVFLRNWRAAVIPTVAVPVSLIGTFGVMYLCDYSLNTMSLMALIVATGFVVDDAIVVVENIMRHIERGESVQRAAFRGTREVGFTVLSMSISLIAVFIPILLMGGLPGRLFREFAVTLSAAILISMLVSLTLTPMMAAHLLRRPRAANAAADAPATAAVGGFLGALGRHVSRGLTFFARGVQAGVELTVKGYGSSLYWALRHGRLMMLLLAATVGLNFYLYSIVPKGFFPQQDTGMMLGFFSTDDGTSFESMKPKLDRFRQVLLRDPAINTVTAYASGRGGSNSSFLAVQLKPFAERKLSVREVIARLRPQLSGIPGARLFLVAQQDIRIGGRQSSSAFQYTLMASDLEDLKEWMPRVQKALAELPELIDVDTDVEDRGRQVTLSIDRDAAQRLGVPMASISNVLNNSFSQRQVSIMYGERNQYRVVMNVAPRYAQDPESLRDVYVLSQTGQRVPLMAVAKFEINNAPLSVRHQGLSAADTISFDVAPGVSLGQANAAIDQAIAGINLPSEKIQAGFQGTAKALQSALANQPWLILGALVTMYIVLGILYESTIHPITILSTLPSAGVGALLALLLLKTEFTLIALIGVFLLIGIVKKNAIMMVDFALEAQRKLGLSAAQAIHQACMTRFRPILMTTCAAIFGAMPLVFASGAGVEMRQPLGITILGGLLVSQLLTLYTTPVVYLYLDRLRVWLASRPWSGSKPVVLPTGTQT
ncbi:MAG: efflux RND transporter permease subunit [Alcaligenaceae bacterium]|nr:efflux RND transporter permease subunit [Alcaligenaceae bacterium]